MSADHRKAIEATIPPGNPHSTERRDWCKEAIRVYARVLLEHSDGEPALAMMGLEAGFRAVAREMRNGTLGTLEPPPQGGG